jgi:Flp pilus assembly protein TadG
MRHSRSLKSRRRGAVLVLAAILLVPIVAMLAFAINLGYIVSVRTQLQNAADSAALAGAGRLMVPQLAGNPNSAALAQQGIADATSEAQKFSLLNQGGGTKLTLPASDVVVGYLDNPFTSQQPLQSWSAGNPYPNSVQVTVRRDNTANSPLALWFGGVTGTSNWNGNMTATASFTSASTVTGFSPAAGVNGSLLPIAIDVNLWNTFLSSGKSPDGNVYDNYTATLPVSGTQPPTNVSGSPDNIPEFNGVYPTPNSPGNFGLVDIGPPPGNSTTVFRNWINNGPSSSDLSYFGANGLQATPDSPATVTAGPGLKSTLQSDMQAVIGQPRSVLLFSSYTSKGSYTIVGFAGVTIVKATGSGNNMQVAVQPMVVVDSTATTGNGSGSNFIYSTSPLSLSR